MITAYEFYTVASWITAVVLTFVVLAYRRSPSAALAWLLVIYAHPLIGAILYLMFGGLRLPFINLQRLDAVKKRLFEITHEARHHQPEAEFNPSFQSLAAQVGKIGLLPPCAGNQLVFRHDSREVLRGMIQDIDHAKTHVHLLSFIFIEDVYGTAVVDALIRARHRGVECRLLLDAVGSRRLLGKKKVMGRLREAGVQVQAALPVGNFRKYLSRIDLRNHRKALVVDGAVGWTGSQNIVEPTYGGRRGHPWYDVMARLEGPVVNQLQMIFLRDWIVETGESIEIEDYLCAREIEGGQICQVVGTGPRTVAENFKPILVGALNLAREEIVVTTPYFVPDESVLLALQMACDRGVQVKILVPKRGDQILTAAAGRSYYSPLLSSGGRIFEFEPGLIHAKTTVIDRRVALFGTANVDIRSFTLNFELNVVCYSPETVEALKQIQDYYLRFSREISYQSWMSRPRVIEIAEAAANLLSPIL